MTQTALLALITTVYLLCAVVTVAWVRNEGENWPNSLLCGAIWPFYLLLLIGSEL